MKKDLARSKKEQFFCRTNMNPHSEKPGLTVRSGAARHVTPGMGVLHYLMVFKSQGVHRRYESNNTIKPSEIILDGHKEV